MFTSSISNTSETISTTEVVASIDENNDRSIQVDNVSSQAALPEPVKADENISLMNQLTEKLNQINLKVDQLFEQRKQAPLSPGAANENGNELAAELVQVETESIAIDASSKSASRIINLARQSFWNGNTEQAEKFYLDLSKFEDADPDVYGELGNVYYAQGKWKQAGEAYYEAAVRLLDLKHKDQAGYLLRVIQGLDEESANKLRQKMSG